MKLHDYNICWDYELDENVSKEYLKLLNLLVKEIKKNLIPKLKVFKDFEVHPVILNDDVIGVYCSGTSQQPVIGVDIGNTLTACEEYPTNFGTALMTTILHELAHAIQEYKGKEFDETEAEDFAFDYEMFGVIDKI